MQVCPTLCVVSVCGSLLHLHSCHISVPLVLALLSASRPILASFVFGFVSVFAMGNCTGTSAQPPNPDYVDLTHFELLKVVGKGGFGKVNAITQLSTQELLALKRIEKSRIIKSKSHLSMVWTERKIMSIVRSPFLCHLRYAFESDTELFLVMPFLQGGDLRYHLKERGRMREETAKFYTAQIVLGLEELHSHWIVYRDLKPENVLLDARGNIQITDFGLAFMLKDEDKRRTRGQAGTRGYMAPETMGVRGYGLSVDYFSLGVMLYELLHGVRPWKNIDTSMAMMGLEGEIDPLAAVRNHKRDAEKELEEAARGLGAKKESVTAQHKREDNNSEEEEEEDKPDVIRFSSRLTEDAKSLLLSLLEFNPNKRLGCLSEQQSMRTPQLGWTYVKAHPWFANIEWAAMEGCIVSAPFTPDITHANCTPDADLADQLLDKKPKRIREDEQKVFAGWSWNTTVNKDGATSARAAISSEGVEDGKVAGDGKSGQKQAAEIDISVGEREGKVRGRDEDEEEQKVEMADEEPRSFEVRKDEADSGYEEKSVDDGTMAAVSMSEQLPNNDNHNSSSMTAEDRREEKKDTLPPLHSSFLPPPSSTTIHSSTASHGSLSISAPEPSNSSAAYSSPSHTPRLPLVITTADASVPTDVATVGPSSAVRPAAVNLLPADTQTGTTAIHLPLTPLSPPSHHRQSSSTSSSSTSSSSAHLLPSASSSVSIQLAFSSPLTSLPSSSRPSITSTHVSSNSTHTTHRQSHSTGQLSLRHEREEPSPPLDNSAVGLSVPTVQASVLSVDRKERRSTLKEKRELKPIVAAEHTRTSSTPSMISAAAM